MLLCDRDSNKGFRNRKQYLGESQLYYGLPSHTKGLYRPENSLAMPYCIGQYAHVLFVRTHTSPLTLPMLVQQCFREIVQPFYPPSQDDCIGIILPKWCQYHIEKWCRSSRIGVCGFLRILSLWWGAF